MIGGAKDRLVGPTDREISVIGEVTGQREYEREEEGEEKMASHAAERFELSDQWTDK